MARRGAQLSEPESYWLIPGRLMGGEWPAPYLDWLESRGIVVLINLTERQYPVPDGAAPEETQISRFCFLVGRELAAQHKVYAHCLAGCGRTGTMMACYLIYRERLEPRVAIARVRAARRCSVETDAQEDVITE